MAKETDAADQETLYTLTEVSEKTGISMPTLQRYKKNYQDRIPSVGKGRRQRYPANALEVFEAIKEENIKRRGRPPKSESKKKGGGRKSKKKAAASSAASETGGDLLTLTKVAEETGISYPTLVRYVKLHEDRIPFEGTGRSRRYHPEAIGVFQEIRSESSRGRKKKSPGGGGRARRKASPSSENGDLSQRVASLEKAQASLEKQIRELITVVRKPLKVTIKR
jgi:predicted DNA-binding transcriptional regulator AlpA